MFSQDVQTDAAVAVDVWMVDSGGKVESGGLEGVICREVDVEEENASGKRTVALLSPFCRRFVAVVAENAMAKEDEDEGQDGVVASRFVG